MAEFRLKRAAPLAGLHETVGATVLREIDGARITTLSLPNRPEQDVVEPLKASFGGDLPDPGESIGLRADGAHLLRLGSDRMMILQLPDRSGAPADAPDLPDGLIYRVDQSDYWVLLDVSGPLVDLTLERSCRVDLHREVFPPGHLARTPIDTVSTILIRLESDRFLLMAPRSFARSLAQTLRTSLRYVSG